MLSEVNNQGPSSNIPRYVGVNKTVDTKKKTPGMFLYNENGDSKVWNKPIRSCISCFLLHIMT